MSTEPAACSPAENWIVVLSRTVLNTVAFAIVTVAPGSNWEPVIVPHVPAVVTTFGETPPIVGCGPVGVDGTATDDAGSDDGTDGDGGNPPQVVTANASTSTPNLVSFTFALPF